MTQAKRSRDDAAEAVARARAARGIDPELEPTSLAERAFAFAEIAHAGQRYGAGPYTFHLREVMRLTREHGFTSDAMQAAAALHDILEDTPVTRAQVQQRFGEPVSTWVDQLTHRRGVPVRDYLAAMSDEAFAIKLADRCSNVEHLDLGAADQLTWLRGTLLPRYEAELALYRERAASMGSNAAAMVERIAAALAAAGVRLNAPLEAFEASDGAKALGRASEGAASEHRPSGVLALRLEQTRTASEVGRSARVRAAAQIEGALLACFAIKGIGQGMMRVAAQALLTTAGRQAYGEARTELEYIEEMLLQVIGEAALRVVWAGVPTDDQMIALEAVCTLLEVLRQKLLTLAKGHAPAVADDVRRDLDHHVPKAPLAERLALALVEERDDRQAAIDYLSALLSRTPAASQPRGSAELVASISVRTPQVIHQDSADLDVLLEAARVGDAELVAFATRIGAACGGQLLTAPLKLRTRAEERIRANFGGDARRVTDLTRASLAFDTLEQLYAALRRIDAEIAIVGLKDRFVAPFPNGYRDLLLNVRLSNGHIAELQLHLKPVMETSHDIGRALYVGARGIFARAGGEGRPLNAEEWAWVEEWNRAGQRVFADAVRESQLSALPFATEASA